MGVIPYSLETLQQYIGLVGGFNGCRMMELGSQQMSCHYNIPEGSAAKSWFERMGVKHTSIDMNGELGALKLDLACPIEAPAWEEAFDLVTDFGTSEHVAGNWPNPLLGLYHCRANCHRWCRPGGLLIFCNPMRGHWPQHGYHFFTEKHYEDLAALCPYDIVRVWNHPTLGNSETGYQISAVLQKRGSSPFLGEADYLKLCAETVFTK